MPVISPRRSSSSAGSSLYGTLSSTSGNSSVGSSNYSSSSYSSSSYNFNRASSLSKGTGTGTGTGSSYSTYSPSYNLNSYSYSPRTTQRSSSSSYNLSGGSTLGSYRNSSYLGTSHNDTTTSSRYGFNKKTKVSDTLKKDANNNETKKPPSGVDSTSQSKRFSGSYSSSSLARLVATSGLDLYEKYSPAHYKPPCELSRSRSAVGETGITVPEDSENRLTTQITNTNKHNSRYNRLYSSGDSPNDIDTTDDVNRYKTRRKLSTKLLNSSSASAINAINAINDSDSDIPIATFTLRSNRMHKAKPNNDSDIPKNGQVEHSYTKPSGISTESVETVNIKLNDLKMSKAENAVDEDFVVNCKTKMKSDNEEIEDNELNLAKSANGNQIDEVVAPPNSDTAGTKKSSKKEGEEGKGESEDDIYRKIMIDVNKGRNNFQKLPILKSKCDYYTSSLKTSSSNKNPIIGSKLNRLSAEEEKKLNRNIIDNFRTPTNPVREANQQFFLVSEYKDKNFLKEECKIAHAQVYKPQLKSRNQSQNTSGRVGSGPDNKNNNIITTQLKSCNNINCRSVSLTKSTSPSEEIKKRIKTIANTATDSSSALNGMRRSVNVEQIGTTATAVNVHKVDLEFKVKALPTSAKTTAGVGNSVTCTSTGLGSSKTSNRQIKPLVHRTIPTTTITAVAAAARLAAAQNNVSFTNRVNNNSSSSSTINGSNTNNNMQTSYKLSSDHDDIKYIDSDEPTTVVQERKREICDQNCCTQKSANPHAGADASKTRIRPKSTIICSATNHVFEKVNNYKYANGSVVNAQRNCSSICKGSAIGSTDCISDIRRSGIDSHSIKASIDKFNSLNDQKRLPFNSVQLRSHGGSGSTSNLQHRHSSDFDNCNLQLGSNSGGGSLTRANYRTSINVATPAVTATNGKLNTSMHPTPSIALYSTTRALLNTSTNSGSNTSSLPSKSKNHELLNRSLPLSPYSRDAKDNSSSASSSASSRQENTNGTSLHETKKLNSISSLIESDDSIRSSSIRSALPPSSPSASRYLDRETGRTSAYTSIHSNNDDVISGKISGEEKSEGLCGLKNIGNTCFMNSVIQCLSHTSELTKFLRSHNAVRSSPSKDQQILHEFARLIRDMWSNGTRSVTPMELKRAFSAKHRMYSDYNQQDAQEFLRFFLDSLHCALNSGMKAGSLKIDENLTDNKKADLTWEWYTRQENSLIRDLFVGQLKSTLKCTICNNASVTFDPFWDLSVPLPSSSRCKLDACLDLFIREEVLDGDEMPTCSKCKTRRKCTKSFTIQRFPKYLVIHLKRFSETRWSKLSNIVEFPTSERELNMGPYASNKSNSINYSLYAISNHMGSTAGGHYVALCKHPVTKKWHEFNDNVVSDALPESHLTSSSAYILFYERV